MGTRSARVYGVLFVVIIMASWMLAGVLHPSPTRANLGPPVTVAGNEPIEPIPLELELDTERASLGRKLFEDPLLSSNNAVSCASCHVLDQAAIDPREKSIGVNGVERSLNSPTIFNSQFQFKQFWAGQAETTPEAVDGPLLSPKGLGATWPDVLEKLEQSPEYKQAFSKTYRQGITEETVRDAIFTFEQSLYTPNSRFDQFLRGDANALTNDEKEGYRRFKAYGCASCHQGLLLGGNFFQKSGIFGNYAQDRGDEDPSDLGRFNVTGEEDDRYVFKVPGLRNIK
ncbi:MAG: cytochrome B6, partial [Merismopedia sp. SIO2A8]|nr:cytochrome B6 [Merismopedia sp. SIO2A8]